MVIVYVHEGPSFGGPDASSHSSLSTAQLVPMVSVYVWLFLDVAMHIS